jgi:hypothetical protein
MMQTLGDCFLNIGKMKRRIGRVVFPESIVLEEVASKHE